MPLEGMTSIINTVLALCCDFSFQYGEDSQKITKNVKHCWETSCQEYEDPQKQRLKERFKSNFQTRNITKLCNSKTRTRTNNKNTKCAKQMWKRIFYYANNYKHEHEKNMTRLWSKIVLKICVEQIKGNERSYLYPFGDLVQESFQGGFYVCIE
jgi:hypothetical protein